MKNEPRFGRTNYDQRGAIINTISYKNKLDSHITELVAEKNRERHVSIHAKQIVHNICIDSKAFPHIQINTKIVQNTCHYAHIAVAVGYNIIK